MMLVGAIACGPGGGGLFKQYEYEEEVYLDLDGSATVIVNASIPALVALRGFDLDPNPRARLDRSKLRAQYESPVTRVTRVSRPWRRNGRRFVQVRVEVDDIRTLSSAAPFAWSDYRLYQEKNAFVYRQELAPPPPREVGDVRWDGSELVAFRLHLPSRISFHNAPSRRVERGNILAWQQPLRDRRAGEPLRLEARMETSSILYRTLWLFGMAFGSAMAVLGMAIWWVVRKKES